MRSGIKASQACAEKAPQPSSTATACPAHPRGSAPWPVRRSWSGEEACPRPLAAAPQKPLRGPLWIWSVMQSSPFQPNACGATGRAFIHHVWEEYKEDAAAERLTLADFKEQVVHSELKHHAPGRHGWRDESRGCSAEPLRL